MRKLNLEELQVLQQLEGNVPLLAILKALADETRSQLVLERDEINMRRLQGYCSAFDELKDAITTAREKLRKTSK